MEASNKNDRPPHPRAKANILEILTFGWMLKLFNTGQKRDLEINDLYVTLNEHESSLLGDELEKRWKSELFKAKNADRQPSLTKVLIRMFGLKFLLLGLLHSVVELFFKIVQPLLIGGLLMYFNPDASNDHDLNNAYIYASCLALSMLITLVMYHAIQIEVLHFGMKMRIACCSAIYKKALRLSTTALGETTVGQIVNLLSNDVNRFDALVVFLNYMWIGPLQTVVVTYFLWQEIGVSSVIGVIVLLVAIPLQGWMGKSISKYRLKTANRTDERVRLMNEIISGIQVIKMYTWEKPFADQVERARKNEIAEIRGTSYLKTALISFMLFHTKIALFFALFSYVLLGNYISAQKVFVITSYFNLLRTTMTGFFPQGIAMVAETTISIKRLQKFLMYGEITDRKEDNYARSNDGGPTATAVADPVGKLINGDAGTPPGNDAKSDSRRSRETPRSRSFGIVVSDVTAKWTQTENSLKNVGLTVAPGRLVVVIGPVGAGKSSLLQAILGEMPISEGRIAVRGAVSYASQEPWLFAGTVQQNILFGSSMDQKRYTEVINVCALKADLNQLPYGDKTMVGERGVSLSGGQRARISLARAIYKQADIYLLDDPLSAVDPRVGKHLFKKCIKGYLKDKICVLVTHQMQYLASVDQVVIMENGNVVAEGSYHELRTSNSNLTRLFGFSDTIVSGRNESCSSTTTNDSGVNAAAKYVRQVSTRSVGSSIGEVSALNEGTADGQMEVEETRTSGSISRGVYISYFAAGGGRCKICFFIFICVINQVIMSGGDYWMTYWVNLEEHVFRRLDKNAITDADPDSYATLLQWSISRQICYTVFAIFTLLLMVTIVIRAYTFVSVSMTSSMTLHNEMFDAITRAAMNFFNTNSSGRILNRFSKDMGSIDEVLPTALMDCIQIGLWLLAIVTIIGIINFYLMVPTAIVAIIFYKLRIFYLSTSRSVKRLEGVTRSPVFAHLNASLRGLTTIRAYGAEQILSKEFDNHQNLHSSAWYIFISSSRAFGLWLDIICFIYICIVTYSFLVIGNDTYGGNVGLAITQAIGLAGMFQWGMRQSAELENQMTSVERIVEYTNVPREGALESRPDKKPPSEWPSNGEIIFKNFYLRYNAETHFVVKNLNVKIGSMEKVGIVGRTGAGKSSLIGALFRLAINEGQIVIDDVEIHGLGLHDLRSKISIIPQEPVLFSGTMRTNLDPFYEYSDHVLWDALHEVELKDVVESLPDGLNSKMSEGGSNFSVGQRQLVCLARAIVRNNKILVLDEATANVDPQTDALIQNTIRNKFRTCTVLTIAHRLNTVIDSDKMLVMDAGTMVEFGHSHELLKNEKGFLYKMVKETGPANSELLHRLASESYINKTAAGKEGL